MHNHARTASVAIAFESSAAEPAMEVVQACSVCRSNDFQTLDGEYNFSRCRSCGYIFDSPRPSLEEIAAFYSQPQKYDSWLNQEAERDALWQRRLKKLLPYKAEGSLLDIGAGTGQFLHHAKPFFMRVAGTEISESAVKIAKEKYGIDLHAGQIEDLCLPPGSFNNVTLFHVLEHVHDPMRLMKRCWDLLSPQGILVIAVPNDVLAWTSGIKKLGKQLGLKTFQTFSLVLGISKAGDSLEIHLSHFTPQVLRQLVESAGFEIVEESLDPYYVASGARLLVDRAYYGLHRLIHSALMTNYYDTIWMIARKS
jgi:SAM-dependent methyltransferase